jgi:beta-lactamase class A
MTSPQPHLTRRALLGTAAFLPVAGWTQGALPGTRPSGARAAGPTAPAQAVRHERFFELEAAYGARLGVYALDTGTGAAIAHRPDERFAFCSVFKGLAAAALLHCHPRSYLDTRRVWYTDADLLPSSSAFTRAHVSTGMTLSEACTQAILHSDGTAGNLMLKELGGPHELTRYLRRLGDTVTRMDRFEPAITEAAPGDVRDTTSARAIGTDYRRIVLGDALPPDRRRFLVGLLKASEAGAGRIRAVVSDDWCLAHKSGSGDYATLNDVGVVWPSHSAPLVIAIMSRRDSDDPADAKVRGDDTLVAKAASYVINTLTS